jgi:hypothetical protein
MTTRRTVNICNTAPFEITLRCFAPVGDAATWDQINAQEAELAKLGDVTLPPGRSVTPVPVKLWTIWRQQHAASDLVLGRKVYPV